MRKFIEQFPAHRAIVIISIIWLVIGGGIVITSIIDGREYMSDYLVMMMICPCAVLMKSWLSVDQSSATVANQRNEVELAKQSIRSLHEAIESAEEREALADPLVEEFERLEWAVWAREVHQRVLAARASRDSEASRAGLFTQGQSTESTSERRHG